MDLEQINEIRSEIPQIIEACYPVQVWSLHELGGYQNWVYRISCNDTPIVLRVTPATHRRLSHLQAEITLVKRLRERGVPVAAPVQLERVPAIKRVKLRRGIYYISAFEHAPGMTWREAPQRDNSFVAAGRVLGRIHRETKDLPEPLSRPSWEENHYLRAAKRVVPRERRWVVHSMNDHIDRLRALSREPSEFGLIHGDYNFANMLYSPEGVTVIDFDEAEYNWYAYDLAVYIFYYLLGGDPGSMDVTAGQCVWTRFLEGYRTECTLPEKLTERLADFLRLREFALYSSIFGGLASRPIGDWQRSFLRETERRLRTGRPFVDVEALQRP